MGSVGSAADAGGGLVGGMGLRAPEVRSPRSHAAHGTAHGTARGPPASMLQLRKMK